MKSTMEYTKWLEESNKATIAVLECVRSRPTTISNFRLTGGESSKSSLLCLTTYSESRPIESFHTKGQEQGTWGQAGWTSRDSLSKNTCLVFRNLVVDTWEKSSAGQKLHEQVGILRFDDKELESMPSRPNMDPLLVKMTSNSWT